MVAIPSQQQKTRDQIYKHYVDMNDLEQRRGHLGASIIGKPCERELWYNFRFANKEQFSGRMLRLFQAGHLEEFRFVDDLRNAGIIVDEVDTKTGQQFRVNFGPHCSGYMDGIGLGVLEAPKTKHLLEFKTHGDKSFKELLKYQPSDFVCRNNTQGIAIAKPEHYAQMQIYMHCKGLTRGLYVAVNKNTDELYLERVHYDAGTALKMIAKGERIVEAQTPPERIATKSDAWACKFCSKKEICWEQKLPDRNCRTCAHSTPEKDSTWSCAWHDKHNLSIDDQVAGCPKHLFIPQLVPAEVLDVDTKDGTISYNCKDAQGNDLVWVDGNASA